MVLKNSVTRNIVQILIGITLLSICVIGLFLTYPTGFAKCVSCSTK